ncbi:MAG: hypothetical protein Q8M31_12560 [Beijerinckiaceae bacterium]|nr:hypothetical protein [Beijerinckiaceae bacterium]
MQKLQREALDPLYDVRAFKAADRINWKTPLRRLGEECLVLYRRIERRAQSGDTIGRNVVRDDLGTVEFASGGEDFQHRLLFLRRAF